MVSYQKHFQPKARIFFVDEGKVQDDLDTKDFFAQQEKFIKDAKGNVEEYRVRSVVQESALGASAVVYWKLREGEHESTGVDRFTIIRTDDGSLKILSLTYYPKKF